MESTIVRRIKHITRRKSVAGLGSQSSSSISDSNRNHCISDLEESYLNQAERFALQHLDSVRAEKLRRVLITATRRRREENSARENAFRRAREATRRMHVATGFDAEEHFSLVGARIAKTAERIGTLLGEYLDRFFIARKRNSEIVLKSEQTSQNPEAESVKFLTSKNRRFPNVD